MLGFRVERLGSMVLGVYGSHTLMGIPVVPGVRSQFSGSLRPPTKVGKGLRRPCSLLGPEQPKKLNPKF